MQNKQKISKTKLKGWSFRATVEITNQTFKRTTRKTVIGLSINQLRYLSPCHVELLLLHNPTMNGQNRFTK